MSAEIIGLCLQAMGGFARQQLEEDQPEHKPSKEEWDTNPLYTIAPEDTLFLADKTAGFVRGWNVVKREGGTIK